MHEHTRYLVGYEAIGGFEICSIALGDLIKMRSHNRG